MFMNTKMDTIKVSIKRLGKISNSEIEINRMVLFTGESGLGKSYMAILCHYFFYVLLDYKRMAFFFQEKGIDFNEDRKAFKNTGVAKEILKSELEAWMAKDAIEYMRYMLGYEKLNGEIVVHLPDSVPEKIIINYEEQLVGFTDKEEPYILLHTNNLSYRVLNSDNFGETPYAVILRHELVTLILSKFKAVTDSFVFPPSRGFALSDQFTPVTGLYESYHKTLLKRRRDGKKLFEEITYPDSHGHTFHAIPDGSFVLGIRGGREELRGEAYEIRDGVFTQISRESDVIVTR